MKLNELKETICRANCDLVRHGLVLFTWGNVSGVDRDRELVAIKPSGVNYDDLTPQSMVIVDFNGAIIEGDLKPSSDTATHLVLYRTFKKIGGVVHTHSTYAVAWAQAQRDIPAIGTTHADYFCSDIPCTRSMTENEIRNDYEKETGHVITECFETRNIRPEFMPGVLVANHGPFTWGKNADEAVHNAAVLEEVAKMSFLTAMLNPELPKNSHLIDKHFSRKHGPGAYYGQ